MALTVNLIGPSPWGFRIFGGRDFKKAITVSKVNGGSKAEQADLQPGDIILEINGENTADMLNVEAQNKIKNSKTQLQLLVERPEPPSPGQTNGISTPEQLTGRFQESVIVSRDENQNYREYTTQYSSPASLSPGPYSPDPPASPDGKRERLTPTNKSIQLRSWSPEERSQRLSRPLSQEFSPSDYRSNSVSSRTPTPPGRYSPHSPIDRDVPMSPRRSSSSDFAMQRFDKDSEVYKMIQENKEFRSAPRQSNTFKMLQEVLEADEKEAALRFPGKLSSNSPNPGTSVGVKKNHTCEKCGTSIVTLAVRISDDHFRHPECYTCTDCGLNLKMRGHFWVGDVMYCEKHASQRYQGTGSSPRATVSPRQ
ncbi:PDZ and LIM domain protein 2 isoform X2 [Pempheris klunzingeri]|uniref:PDZ and LIM domain protein 2 isoform X2 n=1 Tax=Pempheris klunzingeri TaxID=3127111 RepID=UPI00397FD6F1